jgi:threonine/homoserine/homoserine lactone efflux protein
VIIIGLAASVSPVAIMFLISILSRQHARRNSLIFLLGYTLTLTALGIVGVLVFHLGSGGRTSKVNGYIDLALGILCLLAILFTIRKPKKQETTEVESDLRASRAFSLGSFAMIVNTSTLIIYISGLHAIAAAGLEPFNDVIALALLTLFTLTSLIIPIIIYFALPDRSEKVLASLRVWLSKHSKAIGIAVLLIIGVYLVIKGIWVIV